MSFGNRVKNRGETKRCEEEKANFGKRAVGVLVQNPVTAADRLDLSRKERKGSPASDPNYQLN